MKRFVFLIGLSVALTGCAQPNSYYLIDGQYYRYEVDHEAIQVLDRNGRWVAPGFLPRKKYLPAKTIRSRFSPDARVSAGVAEGEKVRRLCIAAGTCGIGTVREAGQGEGGHF